MVHRRRDKTYGNISADNPFPVNIVQLNGDMMFGFKKNFAADYLKGKYNIGYWAWELPEFPADWTTALYAFNELWTPSNFCVEAFSQVSPFPVLKMPHSIDVPETTITRSDLKLPPDKFIFLFVFDFFSVFERKNPLAIIEAFKQAFGTDKRVLLFLKSINGASHKEKLQELKNAAKNAENIKTVDEIWDRKDVWGLIRNCDAYVSLHRSEDFGLTIAEAMFCAKPVIATDYSANSEYMNVNNGFPVRYKLEKLERDYGHYKKGNSWAEADISHAAALMRRVFDFPEEAKQTGERAAENAKDFLGAEAVGRSMRRRLEYINFLHDDFQNVSNLSEKFSQIAEYEINLKQQTEAISNLENRIEMMEASRFWKIRNHWFRVKDFVRGRS